MFLSLVYFSQLKSTLINLINLKIIVLNLDTTNLNEPGSMRKTSTKRKRIDINERGKLASK